jgi:hypothetical protein
LLVLAFALPCLLSAATADLAPAKSRLDHATSDAAAGAKLGFNFDCQNLLSAAPAVDRAMQAADSGYVRIGVDWGRFQPSSGEYSSSYISTIRSCFADAHSHRQKVLAVFSHAPSWADPYTSTGAREYATAAAHVVALFPASSDTDGIQAIEIWNEANNAAFWSGTEQDYEAVLRDAYRAVHPSGTPVVLSGAEHIDEPWYRRLLSDGYGSDFDILGVHPYPNNKANLDAADYLNGHPPNTIDALRTDLKTFGFPDKPIWVTEMGYWVGTGSRTLTARDVATGLTNFYTYIRGRCYGCQHIAEAFWFTSYEPGGDPEAPAAFIQDPDFKLEPAYTAFKNLR